MGLEGPSAQTVFYFLEEFNSPAVVNLDAVVAAFGKDQLDECNRVLEALGQNPLSTLEFERIQDEIDQRMNRPPTPGVEELLKTWIDG